MGLILPDNPIPTPMGFTFGSNEDSTSQNPNPMGKCFGSNEYALVRLSQEDKEGRSADQRRDDAYRNISREQFFPR